MQNLGVNEKVPKQGTPKKTKKNCFALTLYIFNLIVNFKDNFRQPKISKAQIKKI